LNPVSIDSPNPVIHASLYSGHAPMKIVVVTETYPPEVNGVALTIGRLVNALIERNHHVMVVRPRQDAKDKARSQLNYDEILVTGIAIPNYSLLKFGLPAQFKLKNALQSYKPDVIHIATEGPLGWSALWAAQKLNIPVTSSFHTNFHHYSHHYKLSMIKNLITRYLRKFHNQTLITLVPTSQLKKELHRKKFNNLVLWSRGVDTQLFHPARRKETIRAQWGLKSTDLALIYVGRLALEKNIQLVLKTYHALSKTISNAKLILVGDGPLYQEIKHNYPDVILCGSLSGENLAAHYASGDIFLFPSTTETFGNVTTEALASGLGVIAYNQAAAAELIQNHVNGIAIRTDDEEAFIAETIALALDQSKLASMRKAASQSVSSLSWMNIFRDFETILKNAIHRHQNTLMPL
jgi:glycosyltransferase involved in cell wall biosynthesis